MHEAKRAIIRHSITSIIHLVGKTRKVASCGSFSGSPADPINTNLELFMFKTIDYRTTRALQICIVFVTTLAIQRWLQFSHSAWIGFSVMMIYAGFNSGASLHRTSHRFWGAIIGLFLSYILWFIIRIDYGLILMVIPCVVFMAFFSMGKQYSLPTIFTVTLTALGVDYYSTDHYAVQSFFFEYTRATITALAICVIFEYFIFKKSRLSHQFYLDLQRTVISQLACLLSVVETLPVRQSQYLKLSTQFNVNISELQVFLQTVTHDYHIQNHVFNQLDEFNQTVEFIYNNIRQLFVSSHHARDSILLETKKALNNLIKMSEGASLA